MSTDPRLSDVAFLALAVIRMQHRQARRLPDWRHTVGLRALLDAARALPERSPWDLPALEECDGLARLLAEARQRQDERHGAA